MWIKIRTVLIAVLLNTVTLKALASSAGLKDEQADAVAGAIMDVKAFIDTKDKRYLNNAIDKLQTLIKQAEVIHHLGPVDMVNWLKRLS